MKIGATSIAGIVAVLARLAAVAADPPAAERWSPERAWAWYRAAAPLLGFNYVPAYAGTSAGIWQTEDFDPARIDTELGWAEAAGLTNCRIFLQYLVWEADAGGLKARMDRFLSIADRHRIRTAFVLFDDCTFHAGDEPRLGKQPDYVPGLHHSMWQPSPGRRRVADRAAWPGLEGYVRDVVGRFAADPRVLFWDLYNEPAGEGSRPLVEAAFGWARAARPAGPLTVGVWAYDAARAAVERSAVERSDVVSFHCYDDARMLDERIRSLRAPGRPLICSEWMRRPVALPADLLPVFLQHDVGSQLWSLCESKTGNVWAWGSTAGTPRPVVWQHEIFGADGQPFDPREVEVLRWHSRRAMRVVVPTSQDGAVAWRFTTAEPPAGWARPDFDDSGWRSGPGGFGTSDLPARPARTPWSTPDIWLRRSFDLDRADFADLRLLIHHDDDAEVHIDGRRAGAYPGHTAIYVLERPNRAAVEGLRPGRHLLAVRCHQVAGGQYIDAGLVDLVEAGR